jgi:NAD(P)-dependent dehydrogenase (short-subunit alcohol dehydrogenase family)
LKDYFNYSGKICVITGAASGMGKAAAEALVDMGAKVYALDWAETTVSGTMKNIHVNLGDRNSIDAAFEEVPQKIDCFFGIAGVSGIKTDFQSTIIINFLSNKYITEAYLSKRMQKGGAVAFVTSEAGLRWEKKENVQVYLPMIESENWEDTVDEITKLDKGYPGNVGYVVSKKAMNYYVPHILKHFGPKGIRVNAVLPGTTDTGMKDEFAESAGGIDNLKSFTGFNGRLAESEEMGLPIVFLNSEMASYMNGVMLVVDDGLESQIQAGFISDMYGFAMIGTH